MSLEVQPHALEEAKEHPTDRSVDPFLFSTTTFLKA
jgi:hypothetical protein